MYILLIIIILLFLIFKENKEQFTIGGESEECGIYHNTCNITKEDLGTNACSQYYTDNNNTYKCKDKSDFPDWSTITQDTILCEIDNEKSCIKYSDCGKLTELWQSDDSIFAITPPSLSSDRYSIAGTTSCNGQFDNRDRRGAIDTTIREPRTESNDCENFYYINEKGQNIQCVEDQERKDNSQRYYNLYGNKFNFCKDGENNEDTDGIDNRFCNNEEGYAGQCTDSSVSNIYLVDSCDITSSDNCDDYYEYNTEYGDYYKCKSTTQIDTTDTTDTTDTHYLCDTNLKFKCITQNKIIEILKKIIKHLTAFFTSCAAFGNLSPYVYSYPNTNEQQMGEFLYFLTEKSIINDPVYDLLMKYVHDGGTTGFASMRLNINNLSGFQKQKVHLIRIILNLIDRIYNNNPRILASTMLMGLYVYIITLI